MIERLKAAAASVLGFLGWLIASGGKRRWIWCGIELQKSYAELEKAHQEQRDRYIDATREIISIRDRQIHELTNHAASLNQQIADLRDGSKEAVRVLTEERDAIQRESAAWQGRCKDLSELMGAMKHIIEVGLDGKGPQQYWASVLANTLGIPLPPTGDTSATDSEGA